MESVVLGGLALLPGRKEQPQNWEVEPVHFFLYLERWELLQWLDQC